ncbi:Glycosyltransferase family 4 protein [Candidatus Hepatincolaceae symbiont of Richtersius coronifer]
MTIIIIMPFNNPFCRTKTKPVVLAALPYIQYSSLKEQMIIITPYTSTPLLRVKISIIPKYIKKKNYKYAVKQAIINILKNQAESINNQDHLTNKLLLHIHQDLKLASFLKSNFSYSKVFLVKHGQYFINRFKEQFSLIRFFYYHFYIKKLDKILCISNYVRVCLADNYPKMNEKIIICYNNYGHLLLNTETISLKSKQNQIVFAGKAVKFKGIVEFLLSLIEIMPLQQNYKAVVIVAYFAKNFKQTDRYNPNSSEIFSDLAKELKISAEACSQILRLIKEDRITLYTNLSNQEVFQVMALSKIFVVPTKSNEPFGLVALEGHLAKCAVISSGKGGLKEVSGPYALYLDQVSPAEIAKKVKLLMEDETKLINLALDGYQYAIDKFDPKTLVRQLDNKIIAELED